MLKVRENYFFEKIIHGADGEDGDEAERLQKCKCRDKSVKLRQPDEDQPSASQSCESVYRG